MEYRPPDDRFYPLFCLMQVENLQLNFWYQLWVDFGAAFESDAATPTQTSLRYRDTFQGSTGISTQCKLFVSYGSKDKGFLTQLCSLEENFYGNGKRQRD